MNTNIACNRNYVDPFFRAFFEEDINSREFGSLAMKSDIKEVGENYVLDIDLPGIKKENINLSLEEGYLTVTAKSDTSFGEKKHGEDGFLRRERFSGSASRTYYIGDVEEDKIAATYVDGVLSITFPKEEFRKAEEAHRIAIK